jgi:hypothetical protein
VTFFLNRRGIELPFTKSVCTDTKTRAQHEMTRDLDVEFEVEGKSKMQGNWTKGQSCVSDVSRMQSGMKGPE